MLSRQIPVIKGFDKLVSVAQWGRLLESTALIILPIPAGLEQGWGK